MSRRAGPQAHGAAARKGEGTPVSLRLQEGVTPAPARASSGCNSSRCGAE